MSLTKVTYSMIDGAPVNAKDFGAVGDGATNDTAAIQAALTAISSAGGGQLFLPAGNYKCLFSGLALFTLPANVEMVGAGAATILSIDDNSVAGSKQAFICSGANASIRNLSMVFDVDDGVAFNLLADNLTFDSLILNGGHTALNTTTFHGWSLSSNGTHQGLVISNCSVSNFRFGLLRANNSTGTYRRITVQSNYFVDNYANHIAFNAPNGTVSDIDVLSNTFGSCPGGDAFGTFAIQLGMASVKNYRIIGNHFRQICKESIHLEEAGGSIVVDGNTFEGLDKGANTNGGRGIYVVDSNVGGSSTAVARFVISNNVIEGSGAVSSDFGIYVVRSLITPAERYIISGNVISNFNVGISAVLDSDSSISNNSIFSCTTGIVIPVNNPLTGAKINDNIIAVCTTGISLARGWPQIENNILRSLTTGIACVRPGIFGFHTFDAVTTPVTSSGASPSFLGWHFEATELNISATPTNTFFESLAAPDVCQGSYTVVIGSRTNSNLSVIREYSLNITSAGTVTSTTRAQRTIGNVATTGAPTIASGKLTIELANSGTAVPDAFFQATFNGVYSLP
jgi:hypothetical protein